MVLVLVDMVGRRRLLWRVELGLEGAVSVVEVEVHGRWVDGLEWEIEEWD